MDIEQLAGIYNNFYAPAFEIEIEGKNIVEMGIEVISVSVDNVLNDADYFTFTVNNAFDVIQQDVKWLNQFFTFGKKVKVKMGYVNSLEEIFVGLITSVRTKFQSDGIPQIEISGFDLSYCMMKGLKAYSWENVRHSDIVRKIGEEGYKLKSVIENTQVMYPKVIKKDGTSDFKFLRELAEKNYFEFFVFGETLHFRTPIYNKEPIVTLEWGKSLVNFNPEINIANQVTKVEVRGWNPVTKKEFIGRAKVGDELGKDYKNNRRSGGELVQEICKEPIELTVTYPVFSQEEADKLAKSILNQHAEGLVTGSGETIGIPKIMSGENIFLKGLGKKFSKSYYIERSNHSINGSGYRTTFNVKESSI
ncbi:phage late control D family protein [Bacillus toyonensis]|uniref:phage late control D family protein n=1 Tax=Bacillus toyonensis TaxID=155322 RepID=UPI001C02AE91|nr:hypothetical protein [Bacillus toyonensis]QWH88424.1 phage late control D family protein [Bacillus toyonensis]QWI31599.1 phage late control D family protein [Bacillus toyonensis]